MSLTPHRTDACIKCLTVEQVHQLSELFGRHMASLAPQTPETPQPPATQTKTWPALASCPEADLMTRLSEWERTVEHRLSVLESTLHELKEPSGGSPSLPQLEGARRENPRTRAPRSLYPAEQRARSRMPVLIEYSSTQGYSIIVSSPDGELPITPHSPEWFDLLAARCSFRGCRGNLVGSPPTASRGAAAGHAPGPHIAPCTSSITNSISA